MCLSFMHSQDSIERFVEEWGSDNASAANAAAPSLTVSIERTVRKLNAMHDKYKTIEVRLTNQKYR